MGQQAMLDPQFGHEAMTFLEKLRILLCVKYVWILNLEITSTFWYFHIDIRSHHFLSFRQSFLLAACVEEDNSGGKPCLALNLATRPW
jgi:hypothetical protein